jgi:SAM-dependent methyltransferase
MKRYVVLLCFSASFLYAADDKLSMPKKDPLLNAYPTLNGYGSCFEPIDSMSQKFAEDVSEHRTKEITTDILEIGACYGLLARSILEKRFQKNLCFYTGIDLEEKHLAIATKDIDVSLRDNIFATWTPIAGDFLDVSYLQHINGLYTHIGAFCVLHFLTPEKLQKTLCLMERVLAKGGKAFISTLSADTPVYGPFLQGYYRTKKESGAELPGYIDDFPRFIQALLASDGVPEKTRELIIAQEKNAEMQKPQTHLLFLTFDDLAAQVRKYTKLTIKSEEAIARAINSVQVPYIGIILEKE